MVRTPRQERAQHTVSSILSAAELLLREGTRLSTNKVAARAGVSIGSLYQYFPNKQAIIGALAVRRREVMTERMVGQLLAQASIADVVLAMADALAEDPSLNVALTREVLDANLVDLLGQLPAMSVLVGGFIQARGHHVDDPEMMGRVLTTAVIGALQGALLSDPALLRDERFRSTLVSLVMRTLGEPATLRDTGGSDVGVRDR